MIDETLNAILFLFIGLQMLVIPFNMLVFWLGIISIIIVLASRFISVAIPINFLLFKTPFEKKSTTILTWGGLRGGISVALACGGDTSVCAGIPVPVHQRTQWGLGLLLRQAVA